MFDDKTELLLTNAPTSHRISQKCSLRFWHPTVH